MNEQQIFFSVIVPVLNERRWLGQFLEALSSQTFDSARFEIIAVDNGSTDGSLEILRRNQRVSVLHEAQRDPYLARNRGISAARGSYIALVDADCIPCPDWLETFYKEIVQGDFPIVIGYLAFPEGACIFLRRYEEYHHAKLEYLFRQRLTDYYFGHAGNMAIRADVFAKLGCFRPMPVVGDTEILHRLMQHDPAAVIRYAPGARVVHAEVDNFSVLLGKLFESGSYSETCRQVSAYRIIPPVLKRRIFWECVKQYHYGPLKVATSLAMLLAGWISFAWGRLSTRWGTRQAPRKLVGEP